MGGPLTQRVESSFCDFLDICLLDRARLPLQGLFHVCMVPDRVAHLLLQRLDYLCMLCLPLRRQSSLYGGSYAS